MNRQINNIQLHPVLEHEATEEVKILYQQIRQSLNTPSVPLFFQYLGGFPEYLQYITRQLVPLLYDHAFIQISENIGSTIEEKLTEGASFSDELAEWISRNQRSPSIYNFQNDVHTIFINNVKLTLIFVALREAVKGWAVAAKKIGAQSSSDDINLHDAGGMSNALIYYDILPVVKTSDCPGKGSYQNEGLIRREVGIERNLLSEYLYLCRNDFRSFLKSEEFVYLRVEVEKEILTAIQTIPTPLSSPINVVLELASPYQHSPDLLYLLSEHFPTYAIQRMLFSCFMKDCT